MVRLLPILAFAACTTSGLSVDVENAGPAARAIPCAESILAEEGARANWGDTVYAERTACTTVQHAVEGPDGAVLDVMVRGFEHTVRLEQTDWNGRVIHSIPGVQAGTTVSLTTPFAGEHLLRVVPEGTDDVDGTYELDITCTSGCSTSYSRHPILLMHGMGSPVGGAGSPWGDVEQLLNEEGYRTWAPQVSPWNDSPTRSAEWMTFIDDWRATGTFRKLHLIGHSMGGIDARYIASELDEQAVVASITTIATPHRGSPVADMMTDVLWNPTANVLMEGLADWVAERRGNVTDQSVMAIAWQLSTEGMASFNEQIEDRDDVTYRSWAGLTCRWSDLNCRFALGQEVVGLELLPTFAIMQAHDIPNDGVVDFESATWGEFQGFIAADHGDSVARDNSDPSFYWEAFFLNEAGRLVDLERGVDSPRDPQSYDYDVLFDMMF